MKKMRRTVEDIDKDIDRLKQEKILFNAYSVDGVQLKPGMTVYEASDAGLEEVVISDAVRFNLFDFTDHNSPSFAYDYSEIYVDPRKAVENYLKVLGEARKAQLKSAIANRKKYIRLREKFAQDLDKLKK